MRSYPKLYKYNELLKYLAQLILTLGGRKDKVRVTELAVCLAPTPPRITRLRVCGAKERLLDNYKI